MKREIYTIDAKVVDATGALNTMSGYPQTVDSIHFNNDIKRTYYKACKYFADAESNGYNTTSRQLTLVTLTRVNDGFQLKKSAIGAVADLPDPEPEPEQNGGE